MKTPSDAYQRGFETGKKVKPGIQKWMEATLEWTRRSYPASQSLDYWAELVKLDRERMANPPDLAKFPETKGVGFACGGTKGLWTAAVVKELAYHYTGAFFCSRRLNTRYVGKETRAHHCGGFHSRQRKAPLYGRN